MWALPAKRTMQKDAQMDAVVIAGNHKRDAQDFKLEDIRMKKKWFLQKKTAPPIEGGAQLNKGNITRNSVIASVFFPPWQIPTVMPGREQ